MLLADSAQAVGGKLYVLGGGWSITGPVSIPSAIAMLIEVPWGEANRKHKAVLTLVDGDGNSVAMETAKGKEPLRIQTDFEVGRPPGIKQGSDLGVSVAINLPALPLEPDTAYEWHLAINEQTRPEWRLSFYVRPLVIGQGPPG